MYKTGNTLLESAMALQDIDSYGGVISRSNNYISARPESGYFPGQIVTIELPLECLDLRSASLQFTLTGVPGGTSTYNRYSSDIRSIISRLVVRFGSKNIIDVQRQNLLFNILNDTKDFLWRSTSGAITNGYNNAVTRNAEFSDSNRVYSVQLYDLDSQFLYKVLNLNKLGVMMSIDCYLSQPNEFMESDGTNPSYIMNNVQLHYASLIPSDSYNNLYNEKVSKGGIPHNYITWENMYDSNLLPAGVFNASKVLTFRYTSIIGLIVVMRPSAGLQSLTTNDKLSTFSFNNLNFAQLRIGSANYPVDTKRSYSDLYQMFCETFNLSTRLPLAIAENFNTTNFVLCIPLSKHPKQFSDSYSSISGTNTSISSSMVLDLGFAVPIPANQTVDFYAMTEQCVIFNANGSITWQS